MTAPVPRACLAAGPFVHNAHPVRKPQLALMDAPLSIDA